MLPAHLRSGACRPLPEWERAVWPTTAATSCAATAASRWSASRPIRSRPSYRVAVHLLAYGYDVIPVNPTVDEVLGQRAYPSLADVPGPLEIVDVFRRPEALAGVADEAIAVGAKVLWLQLGLRDEAAAERARAAGPRRDPGPLHQDGALPLVRRAQLGRPVDRRGLVAARGGRRVAEDEARRASASTRCRSTPASASTAPPAHAPCRSTRRPRTSSRTRSTPPTCSTSTASATPTRASSTRRRPRSRSGWRAGGRRRRAGHRLRAGGGRDRDADPAGGRATRSSRRRTSTAARTTSSRSRSRASASRRASSTRTTSTPSRARSARARGCSTPRRSATRASTCSTSPAGRRSPRRTGCR